MVNSFLIAKSLKTYHKTQHPWSKNRKQMNEMKFNYTHEFSGPLNSIGNIVKTLI